MKTRLPETIRVLLISALGSLVSPASHAAPPPVEAFGQLPFLQHVEISPDGTHFAAIQERAGEKVLVVYDISGPGAKPPVGMTFDTNKKLEEEISGFFWPNNERLIIIVEFPALRGGTRAIKTMETRMASISRDFSDQRQVPKQKKIKKSLVTGNYEEMPTQLQARIIHRLPEDPDHILVAFDRDQTSYGLDVFRMNVADGRLDKVLSGNDRVMSYMADQTGEVRLRHYYYDAEKSGYQLRAPGSKLWTKVPGDKSGQVPFKPVMFTENPDQVYVEGTSEAGLGSLEVFDLVRGVVVQTVFSNDTYDFANASVDPVTGKAVGYHYIAHMPVTDYFDVKFGRVQHAVQMTFPGSVGNIVSRDTAAQKWIVRTSSAGDPGGFYIYHLDQNKFTRIGQVYPQLKGATLRSAGPVVYQARDGLEIHGYLTKPAAPGPYKLVVMPHGGPASRSTQEFDYVAQFLASRGYAVFKPNFRGSAGYGRPFEKAGHEEWGLKMQDDVTDGVRSLIDQGLVDPEKICIVGASFGGYSALMGAVRTPELYKCAVSFAGIADLRKLIANQAQYRFRESRYYSLGDLHGDKVRLEATSPIHNIDKIQIPILLIHGKNDRSVPFEHSRKMHKALKKAGKPVKYILFKDGDHNLSKGANRITYLKALETFLDKHIGD